MYAVYAQAGLSSGWIINADGPLQFGTVPGKSAFETYADAEKACERHKLCGFIVEHTGIECEDYRP